MKRSMILRCVWVGLKIFFKVNFYLSHWSVIPKDVAGGVSRICMRAR